MTVEDCMELGGDGDGEYEKVGKMSDTDDRRAFVLGASWDLAISVGIPPEAPYLDCNAARADEYSFITTVGDWVDEDELDGSVIATVKSWDEDGLDDNVIATVENWILDEDELVLVKAGY